MLDNPSAPGPEAMYAYLRDTRVEMFDIAATDIRPDARLYQDLDIDSFDVADLVVTLRSLTGFQIKPEQIRTVRTVVTAVHALADSAHRPRT